MVYNIQNHWVYGFCPSPRILNIYKTDRFGNWISFRLQVREGKHLGRWIPGGLDLNSGRWTQL
jgi:hypothetical protein